MIDTAGIVAWAVGVVLFWIVRYWLHAADVWACGWDCEMHSDPLAAALCGVLWPLVLVLYACYRAVAAVGWLIRRHAAPYRERREQIVAVDRWLAEGDAPPPLTVRLDRASPDIERENSTIYTHWPTSGSFTNLFAQDDIEATVKSVRR